MNLTLTIHVDDPEAVEKVQDAVNEALNTMVTEGWMSDDNDDVEAQDYE